MLDLNSAHTFYSEFAKLELKKEESFSLKYNLKNKDYAGLVIPLNKNELSENFLVEFEIKGLPRTCKFECKLASKDSVWWIVKQDFQITEQWQKYSFKRRHFVYAWGASQEFLSEAKQVELVITAYEDCQGSFELRNIKLTPISAAKLKAENLNVKVSSGNSDFLHINKPWIADTNEKQKVEINFDSAIELGGLIINWDEETSCDFELKIKDEKEDIKIIDNIKNFSSGSSFHYIPDCDAYSIILEINNAKNCKINSFEFKGASFSSSWNSFLTNVALRKKRGLYPRYLYKEQSFWTVIAEDGSLEKGLINEEGLIELSYNYPAIDAFIQINGQILSWNESIQSQKLKDDFFPSITRKYPNFDLEITSYMNQGVSFVDYKITNTSNENISAELILAIRPFQVNPPWQFLNTTGGFRAIEEISIDENQTLINNELKIYSLTSANGCFANEQDSLVASNFNIARSNKGLCSACFIYKIELNTKQSNKYTLATKKLNAENAYNNALKNWQNKFKHFNFSLLSDTVKAQLFYIFSNRSGAAIQPGTRCYKRTWIRDGAMTSSALLQFGFFNHVKDFINWFAPFIPDSGAVPCVVDEKGIDTTPEHDSHGEFLFLVSEYYRYSKDLDLVNKYFDKLITIAKHIEELSNLSNDKPPHIKGLLPKSISHEGYAAGPAYSYWDDLWAVRGLEGLSELANIVGREQKFCSELSEKFKNIVLNSINQALKFHKIDFIPGAADLGDFDATSTTIGADPCTLLLKDKRQELLNTMERYWSLFLARENNLSTYTPYEIRVIGTFIRLGESKKAWQALDFFLAHRRPLGWLHWAEVVFANERDPGFLGDAPHGWVASDFLRAIRSFLIYELDGNYFLGAGVNKEMWASGISCDLFTPEGLISVNSKYNKISINGPKDLEIQLFRDDKFVKIKLPYIE